MKAQFIKPNAYMNKKTPKRIQNNGKLVLIKDLLEETASVLKRIESKYIVSVK